MISRSDTFTRWFGTWFSYANQDPEMYVDGVEKAPAWLRDKPEFTGFRDELAAHIRESSYPVSAYTPRQWSVDEWLRNIYYDLFGPEPAEGDPYPCPRESWGRERLTSYMLHELALGPDSAGEGAEDWLAARGLGFDDIEAGLHHPDSGHYRPEPDGYLDRLEQLTAEGKRAAQPGEPWYAEPE